MQSGVGRSIEIRVYVFRRNARLRPVCAKVVSPLKLQVVLAAGTLIALLEAAETPERRQPSCEMDRRLGL